MRIALISHTHLYWTGIYARFLVAQGHVVRVISFSNDPLDGIDVAYVGSDTPSRFKAISYLSRVPAARSLLRSFEPDAVLATYVSSNGLVGALSGSRHLAISAHGSDVLAKPGGSWPHTLLMRFVCRRSEAIHAVSQPIADELIRCGAAPERIRCFPIGVDTDWFSPATDDRPAKRPLRAICTRNHEPVYGNDTIVAALGAVRTAGLEIRATLLGGGPLLSERRDQVQALGLQDAVDLPGRVSPTEVRDALRDADIYLSASTSDGASSSLLEALACGLFPVVSAIPANTAWIEDGVSGLLFAPGDVEGLTAAIRRAALDDDLRQSARARNRARVVADGNLAVNLAKLEDLLQRVAGAPSA